MQRPDATPESSSASPSFVGILDSLARPSLKPLPAWRDDGLADDIATFSYEHALRAQSRYRPAASETSALARSIDPEQISIFEAVPAEEAAPLPNPHSAGRSPQATHSAEIASIRAHTPAAQNPKSASITIRLSEAECIQLRARAAESGLTVSAYLRSCTFEAESLRAQVKEALAQLRAPTQNRNPLTRPPQPGVKRRSWLERFVRKTIGSAADRQAIQS